MLRLVSVIYVEGPFNPYVRYRYPLGLLSRMNRHHFQNIKYTNHLRYSSNLVICVGNEQIKKPLLNSQVPYFVNFLQLHTFENAILIDRL